MNNIFDGSSISAIRFDGQQYNTMAQYNVFFNNTINVDDEELTTFGFGGNTNPILGNPDFRNAAAGDFRLLSGSVAIDAARSELGPTFVGNELQPIENQTLTDNGTGGIRNATGRLGFDSYGFSHDRTDNVTLPGDTLNLFDRSVGSSPGNDTEFLQRNRVPARHPQFRADPGPAWSGRLPASRRSH